MSWRAAVLGAASAWVGYAWGAHLLAPMSVRRGDRSARRVALTFDDGPDPAWTPRVLDVLDEAEVRGTFFVVGERAARAPDVVRAIARAGHDVGNHGWSHSSLWLAGPRRTAVEIGDTQALVGDLVGTAPRDFRPPWGMMNAAMFAVLHRHRMRCVLWSIQPEGLRPVAAATQARRVVSRAHPGAIVDLHDAEGTRAAPERLCAALPPMIDGLRRAGYELVTLTELLAPAGAGAGSRGTPRPL
jgi:peptidoglycan/xylan/chitin deacetylase (PgdA/CDA1 family)